MSCILVCFLLRHYRSRMHVSSVTSAAVFCFPLCQCFNFSPPLCVCVCVVCVCV